MKKAILITSFITLILTIESSAQNPMEKCKQSISIYCKKTFDLYRPLEFGELNTVPHIVNKVTITKLSDSHYEDSVSKIKKMYDSIFQITYGIVKSTSIYGDERYVLCPNYWESVKLSGNSEVSESFLYRGWLFFVDHYPYGEYSETGKYSKFHPGNNIKDSVFLAEESYLQSFRFANEGTTTRKPTSSDVYCVKHIYRAMNLDGQMVLIRVYFFINKKTYEILNLSGIDSWEETIEETVFY